MDRVRVLSTLEEIKVISDPFRFKILIAFSEDKTPLTVKQLAVRLAEVPAKVHYHVKELERIGVLEIVETREKAGIVEKYYSPTAESFSLKKSIGSTQYRENQMQLEANIFQSMQQEFDRSNNTKDNDDDDNTLSYGVYHLTKEEKEQLRTLIFDFLSDKEKKGDRKPYGFGFALFRKYKGKDGEENGN